MMSQFGVKNAVESPPEDSFNRPASAPSLDNFE